MPRTLTLVGVAIGSLDQQGLGAGASKEAAVATNDGDTSYLLASTDAYQLFVPAIPGDLREITAHTVGVVFRRATAWDGTTVTGYTRLKIGASSYQGAGLSVTTNLSYQLTSDTGLGSATIARADALTCEFGSRLTGGGGRILRGTHYYWDITYNVFGGGFISLLGALGPLGAAITREMIAGLAREVYTRTGTLILPREYAAAFAEWRAYRRPHSIILPGIARA